MKVFKFGGASVKDAESVKNVASIIRLFPNERIVVVISAMGKITNALEELAYARIKGDANLSHLVDAIKLYHFSIIKDLFIDTADPIYEEMNSSFIELEWALEGDISLNVDLMYDQIVSLGEVFSTKIVSAYLNSIELKNKWLDARDVIKTDETYKEARIDWNESSRLINKQIVFDAQSAQSFRLFITQGFIGSNDQNYTTTIGREGSDYTAAILAYCLNADSVTIWKDVPGILNADPKWFDRTLLIPELSYQDAIELAYYGATVIHPKTIKPLQNKHIPLYVKSFISPTEKGTVISDFHSPLPVPCFIFKMNQVLISISPKDFSFIAEDNLGELFRLFAVLGIKINAMQHSAISFSICIDYVVVKTNLLIERLKENYRILYNSNLELITIRYYNTETIERVTIGKEVLLEVKSRHTTQLVVRDVTK